MPIDSSIALQGRPPQIMTPMESMQHAVSIADMLAQVRERQQLVQQRAAEAPLRAAAQAAELGKLNDAALVKKGLDSTVKWNPETQDLDYDDQKAADFFEQQHAPYLMETYLSQKNAHLAAQRTEALQQADQRSKLLEVLATPSKNFKTLTPDKKAATWPDLRVNLVTAQRALGKVLPYKYDPAVVDPQLEQIVEAYKQTLDGKKQLEQARDAANLQNLEDEKLAIEELWTKNKGTGPVPAWFRDKVIAQRAGVAAPAASTYTQDIQLRKLHLKIDPVTGEQVPLTRSEMTPQELADLEDDEATKLLRQAQRNLADARTEYVRTQADPNSPQHREAERRIAVEEQNARTAAARLGIQQQESTERQQARQSGTVQDVERARNNANSMIKAALVEAGSKEAKAIWDRERSHHPEFDIGEYEPAKPQAPAKVAPPAPAPAPGKSALPKPAKGADTATDAIYKAYRAVYGTHEATLNALKSDGWK